MTLLFSGTGEIIQTIPFSDMGMNILTVLFLSGTMSNEKVLLTLLTLLLLTTSGEKT